MATDRTLERRRRAECRRRHASTRSRRTVVQVRRALLLQQRKRSRVADDALFVARHLLAACMVVGQLPAQPMHALLAQLPAARCVDAALAQVTRSRADKRLCAHRRAKQVRDELNVRCVVAWSARGRGALCHSPWYALDETRLLCLFD